ncbi:unnamed protein product [Closterium sp. Yama58-4]|nr:unnamed protein product [Closterium sp. Yama58-4]
MRGTSTMKTRLAAALSIIILLGLFTMVSMSLMYASTHRIDYSAAVHLAAERDEESICEERLAPSKEGPIVSGKNHTLINIAGPMTGLGWWREILRAFSNDENLNFGEGASDSLDCSFDVFQVEKYDDEDLIKLPRPYKGTLIVRDPRSIILEQWLLGQLECRSPGRFHDGVGSVKSKVLQTQRICRLTKEAGINYVIAALSEQGCSGPLHYACVATSIPARVAMTEGLKLFKYEDLWSERSLSLTNLGLWYGLQGSQLERFISTSRIWTIEYRSLMHDSGMHQVRKQDSWKEHFTPLNVKLFENHFGKLAKKLGY